MKKNTSPSGSFNPRIFLSFVLGFAGVFLAMASITPPSQNAATPVAAPEAPRDRDIPVAGDKGEDLDRMEQEWNNRLTYPTGIFNPEWLRTAAVQDSLVTRAVPLGLPANRSTQDNSPLALNPS